MKTSNKILLAIALILVAYLVGYNFALKKVYNTGTYKSRFYQMTPLKFSNFNSINHKAANIVGLKVEQGDKFGVWVSNDMKDRVTVSQQGETLSIAYPDLKDIDRGLDTSIIVTCPNLKNIIASPEKTIKDEWEYAVRSTYITGFKQNSPLKIEAGKRVEILLNKNNLAQLDAVMGQNNAEDPRLTIGSDNHIQIANLQLNGRSQLTLWNPAIGKGNYHFADSSMVTLFGSTLKLVAQK